MAVVAGSRTRLDRALDALDGLSVGDAFGEQFFIESAIALKRISDRESPPRPWPWTDDTAMAISIVPILDRFGSVQQDRLAASFGVTFRYDPWRGYGPAMHDLLPKYVDGAEWRELAPALFDGAGSFGNGAAMRVAPLGAYFADDLERAAAEARRSSVVTHAHPEGVAGAVGVAVAAAIAASPGSDAAPPSRHTFLETIIRQVPPSLVRERIAEALAMPDDVSATEAAAALGDGGDITAQDTVPFCLWCAGGHLDDYEAALWDAVSVLGDRDTNCAIVGGVVGARVGVDSIPQAWFASREPLPEWVYDSRGR